MGFNVRLLVRGVSWRNKGKVTRLLQSTGSFHLESNLNYFFHISLNKGPYNIPNEYRIEANTKSIALLNDWTWKHVQSHPSS